MFTELVSLDADKHRHLRFSQNQPFDFAREMVLIPVLSTEISRVAREMPIVFPKGEGVPQALVGVSPGENLHVKDTGHWNGRYVPAHIRRYPFLLSEIPQTEEQRASQGRQYAIQFDQAARHFENPNGHALLDEQGKPTKVLKKVQQVLMALQQDQLKTQQQVALLDQAGLLVERNITVTQSGENKALSGMRLVDEKAFSQLEPSKLGELRDSGALALVYAHFLSLSNLQDGLIAQATSGNDSLPSIDELFSEGDDDFTFNFDS